MTNQLTGLRSLLIEAQKLGGQGSYERRMPNKKAMPSLLKARSGLARYVESNASDVEGWRLLALAEESLLNYPAAEASLRKVIQLSSGPPDRRDLKKLALLCEYKAKWNALLLQPDQLALLGAYLQKILPASPCDHSLHLTSDWLRQMGLKDGPAILNGLRSLGGYCDCEVLANVVR